MRILIIEDEALAAKRLSDLLARSKQAVEIIGNCDSVRSTLKWLDEHPLPDLLFLDIQLSDGHCFEIFEKREINCPIIFTTAFDEYAIEAFKVNSIAYLLKPFKLEDLEQALNKYENLKQGFLKENDQAIQDSNQLSHLPDTLKTLANHLQKKSYKNRFFVKARNRAYSLTTSEVALFNYEDGAVLLYKKDGQKFLIRYSLDELQNLLDPQLFFRINRQQIIPIDAIQQVNTAIKGKLGVLIHCEHFKEELVVSKHRVSEFRVWLDS